MRHNDYSGKMPDLNFKYDEKHVPDDDRLPDPQREPVLVGARVPIRKVGIGPVDLPVRVIRRDGNVQELQTQASLYCSLDDPNAKGLNLSRLYLMMHETIKDNFSIDGMKAALKTLAEKQGSSSAYCKLKFRYPWTQDSLRSGLTGHIAYQTWLEGQYHTYADSDKFPVTAEGKPTETGYYRFFLTVDYVYSSTCPCSFELAHDAKTHREAAANAHSQRSIAKVTVEFNPDKVLWIEDLVELCREQLPTEVQIVVKRKDEQAFAELNGANLLFSEDACRLLYEALEKWCQAGRAYDFNIVISHEESLHPWNAIAVTSRFDPHENKGTLR